MQKPPKIRKKYGEPYQRKHLLRHGDIKLIANTTGYKYISVVQMLNGDRSMNYMVKAMADELANNHKALISSIEKINQKDGCVE